MSEQKMTTELINEWRIAQLEMCDKIIEMNEGFVITTNMKATDESMQILGDDAPLIKSGKSFNLQYNLSDLALFASKESAQITDIMINALNLSKHLQTRIMSLPDFAALEKKKIEKRHELLLKSVEDDNG